MTLYGYYANKDAILDAVIDLGAERLAIAPASGPWRQRLTQLLTVMHDQLRAHPFIVELRLRRPTLSRGALRFTEAGVAVLIDAGLDPAEAARAFRPLFVYAFGAAAFGHPSGYAGAAERSGQALAALDAEEFPALTALPDEAVLSLAGDGQFASGLALLLDGVEARIASRGLPA
jgi:AcrR family transcriptional regulator